MNKAVVYSSLALNVVLLGACGYLVLRDSSPVGSTVSTVTGAPVAGVAANTAIDAYRKIKTAGVPAAMADRFLAAAVVEVTERDVPVDAYWKSSVGRGVERREAELKAQDAGRKLLLEIVGPNAAANPAFHAFFRPLDSQLAFLSSEKQIGMQKLRMESQRQVEAGKGPAAQAQLIESIRGYLTPDEFFEYELRNSHTAQFLKASGLDFEEREYREVFRIVAASSASQAPAVVTRMGMSGPPVLTTEAMKQIQPVLGDDRFKKFVRTQDPSYRLVASIAGARGLPQSAVDEAYDVLGQGAGKSAEAISAPRSPFGPRRAQSNLSLAQEAELARILGSEAAVTIIRARSVRGSGMNMPPVVRMAPEAK